MTLELGILLSLACAFVANLAFFYKYRGANSVAKVKIRHPFRSARALYSSKWFTLGMLTATASWGLHVGALSVAPMSVVQVTLAAGVVFIAVMAERLFGFEVGRRQWIGLMLTATGLVLLGITLPHMHGAHSSFSPVAMISFETVLFGIGGLLLMGPRMGGDPVRSVRHFDQGFDGHHRSAWPDGPGPQPLADGGCDGFDRRLLRLRARAAGR
jgi:drug/metabolite transporter (DMT)-like permease